MGEIIYKILKKYNNLVIKLLRIKWFCVSRDKFLPDELSDGEVNRRIKICMRCCVFTTVLITFLATLPNSVILGLTFAVIDFVQFQVFLFIFQQQFMYLKGHRELRMQDGTIDFKTGDYLMWLQNNVMLGDNGSIKNKLKSAGSFILRKSIVYIVVKSPFRLVVMNLLRQFLKWLGVIVTHQLLLQSFNIIITLVCAIIAAMVSLWQFYPMCKHFVINVNKNGIDFYEKLYLEQN